MVKLELIAGSRETRGVMIGMRFGSWDRTGGKLEDSMAPPNSQGSRIQKSCFQSKAVVVVTSDGGRIGS